MQQAAEGFASALASACRPSLTSAALAKGTASCSVSACQAQGSRPALTSTVGRPCVSATTSIWPPSLVSNSRLKL